MDKVFPAFVLLALALLGLANSVYFTLIYYRVVNPDSAMLPRFCRLGENTCVAVVFTRYGRLFYVPNSLLGIVFYLLLIDVAISKFVTGNHHLLDYAIGASALTIVVGVYLIWALLVKLKVP